MLLTGRHARLGTAPGGGLLLIVCAHDEWRFAANAMCVIPRGACLSHCLESTSQGTSWPLCTRVYCCMVLLRVAEQMTLAVWLRGSLCNGFKKHVCVASPAAGSAARWAGNRKYSRLS